MKVYILIDVGSTGDDDEMIVGVYVSRLKAENYGQNNCENYRTEEFELE